MQGQYSHGVAHSRCRYPQECAIANKIKHPQNVYLREDALITPLDTSLAQDFAPLQRRHTIAELVDQASVGAPVSEPSDPTGSAVTQWHAKLARYRQALEAGADPAVVAAWIAETGRS
jgi:hypothetical protein